MTIHTRKAISLIRHSLTFRKSTDFLKEHISCRQFIMHEKWEHSMDTGFIFKKMNTYRYKREKKNPKDPFVSTS